jgi:hypothetical protein
MKNFETSIKILILSAIIIFGYRAGAANIKFYDHEATLLCEVTTYTEKVFVAHEGASIDTEWLLNIESNPLATTHEKEIIYRYVVRDNKVGTLYDTEAFRHFYDEIKNTPSDIKGCYSEFSTVLIMRDNEVTISSAVHTDSLEGSVSVMIPYNMLDRSEKDRAVSHLHTHSNTNNKNDVYYRHEGVSKRDNSLRIPYNDSKVLNVVVDDNGIYLYFCRGDVYRNVLHKHTRYFIKILK